MRVLAIDPGERVGWAHGTITPTGPGPRAAIVPKLEVTGHGITALKPFALKLGTAASDYDVIVYENYRISAAKLRQHIGSDVPTLQLVGMIRLAAWLGMVQLCEQTPSDKSTARKSLRADIAHTIDNLPKAHDDSHDGDALLHLWHYYWKRYV